MKKLYCMLLCLVNGILVLAQSSDTSKINGPFNDTNKINNSLLIASERSVLLSNLSSRITGFPTGWGTYKNLPFMGGITINSLQAHFFKPGLVTVVGGGTNIFHNNLNLSGSINLNDVNFHNYSLDLKISKVVGKGSSISIGGIPQLFDRNISGSRFGFYTAFSHAVQTLPSTTPGFSKLSYTLGIGSKYANLGYPLKLLYLNPGSGRYINYFSSVSYEVFRNINANIGWSRNTGINLGLSSSWPSFKPPLKIQPQITNSDDGDDDDCDWCECGCDEDGYCYDCEPDCSDCECGCDEDGDCYDCEPDCDWCECGCDENGDCYDCCGEEPYDPNSEDCCVDGEGGGEIYNFNSEGCCYDADGYGQTYEYDSEDCCYDADGTVTVYEKNTAGCCYDADGAGQLYVQESEDCCEDAEGAGKVYEKDSEGCCEDEEGAGTIYEFDAQDCCYGANGGGKVYFFNSEGCCYNAEDGVDIYELETQGCCYDTEGNGEVFDLISEDGIEQVCCNGEVQPKFKKLEKFELDCCVEKETNVSDIAHLTFSEEGCEEPKVTYEPAVVNPSLWSEVQSITVTATTEAGETFTSSVSAVNRNIKISATVLQWNLDGVAKFIESTTNRFAPCSFTVTDNGAFKVDMYNICCKDENCVKPAKKYSGNVTVSFGFSRCPLPWGIQIWKVASLYPFISISGVVAGAGSSETTCSETTKECMTGQIKGRVGGGVEVKTYTKSVAVSAEVSGEIGGQVQNCINSPGQFNYFVGPVTLNVSVALFGYTSAFTWTLLPAYISPPLIF